MSKVSTITKKPHTPKAVGKCGTNRLSVWTRIALEQQKIIHAKKGT